MKSFGSNSCIIIFVLVLGFWACKKSELASANKTIIFVPSAFTPNGDHHNDTFGIQPTIPLTYFHIKIYDNTNILLFESLDIHNSWDGTYKGKPEPSGSYLWNIEYQADGVQRSTESGYVELIR